MKILAVSDLHLSDKPRDDYRWGFMRRLIKMARKRKPDKIIIAGDITEEKDRHSSLLVNQIVNHLVELSQAAEQELIVVEGNHDYKEEGCAFFQFLERVPNIRWISTPTMLAKPKWLLLPHTNDWKRAWKNIDFTEATGVVAHQTFNTASVGFGRKLDGIPLDAIPSSVPVWSGDVHSPQTTGHITYIGSPYTVDFGDDFRSRVLEWEDGKTTSISTAKWPQKRSLHLTKFSDLAGAEFNRGDIVLVTIDVENMDGWDELRGKVTEYMLQMEWTPWAIRPRVMQTKVRRRHLVQDQASDAETLDAYAKRLALKPKLVKTGKTFL